MLSRGQVEYILGPAAYGSGPVPIWAQAFLFQRKGQKLKEQKALEIEEQEKEDSSLPELVYWEDAPRVLQFNKYIRSGYRANYSYPQCVASVLSLHNETGNIWTHLAPALFLLVLAFGGLEEPWANAPVAYYANTLSVVGCFLLSVCYHTFMGCQGDYCKWLTLDVCGVYMALLGSEWAVIDWGFPCHPNIRFFGNCLYYAVGLAGFLFSCFADNAVLRGLPMLVLTFARIALLALRGVLSGGSAMGYYWGMEAVALFGGVVNVARFPERWLQEKGTRQSAALDYWGNSHQIMHVSVAIGLLLVHWAMALDLRDSQKAEAVCPVV